QSSTSRTKVQSLTSASSGAQAAASQSPSLLGRARRATYLWPLILHLAIAVPLAALLPIWTDEAATMHTTNFGLRYALDRASNYEFQAPLYFLVLSLWRKLDASVFFARLFSIACVALTIRAAFGVARKYMPDSPTQWFIAALALHPYLFWASLEIRSFALVILLSALLLGFLFDGYIADPYSKRSRAAYLVIALLAVYTNYYLGFLLVGGAAALITLRRRRELLSYMWGMFAVAAGMLPLLVELVGRLRRSGALLYTPLSLMESVRAIWRNVVTLLLPADWIPQPAEALRVWLPRLGLAALLAAFILSKRRRWQRLHTALAAIVAVILSCMVLTGRFVGMELIMLRHTALAFLPIALLLFAVLWSVARKRGLLAWSALAAVLYAGALYTTYAPLTKRGDWRRVAAFVEGAERPGEPIVVYRVGDEAALRFYYAGPNEIYPAADASFAIYQAGSRLPRPQQEAAHVASLVMRVGSDRVWLVTNEACGEPGVSNDCRPLEAVVQEQYDVLRRTDFYRSRVWQLRRKAGRSS
ncbi:MAG: hypothetical protein ACT4R6_03485, partial [Gemmatimonadaceae bacterium]